MASGSCLSNLQNSATLSRASERAIHSSPSKTHSRLSEHEADHLSRLKSADNDRVESRPRNRELDFQILGDSRSGHVCNSFKLPPPSVHVSNSGARSTGSGCSVSGLAGKVDVHVSAFSPAQQSNSGNTVYTGDRGNSDSPMVAKTVVVSKPTSSLCVPPAVLSIPPRSSVTTGSEICLGRKVVLSAHMEAPMRHYKAAGFSYEDSRLAVAPSRPSTNRMYDDRWLLFTRWAAAAQIASFIYLLFDTHGLSPQTIKGYRTCLGSVLGQTVKAKVILHKTISDIITSIELQRPRIMPILPQWDLGIVL